MSHLHLSLPCTFLILGGALQRSEGTRSSISWSCLSSECTGCVMPIGSLLRPLCRYANLHYSNILCGVIRGALSAVRSPPFRYLRAFAVLGFADSCLPFLGAIGCGMQICALGVARYLFRFTLQMCLRNRQIYSSLSRAQVPANLKSE